MAPKKLIDPQVGETIQQIRHELGLTQEEFAQKLELTQSAIKNFEGGRVPHASILMDIARLAGTSVDRILGLYPIDQMEDRKKPVVSDEATSWWNDAKRRELVMETKQLVHQAEDKTIETLLEVIKAFRKSTAKARS